MSGTSLDGIDISLWEINNLICKEQYSKEYNFDINLKTDILKAISSNLTLKQFGELNHRLALHGKRTVNIRNLGNQISVDGRFCPIGRSGEWGLTSWSLDTRTITELMKRFLAT